MPCLKDNTITENPSCDPSPSSIPVEVETISESTLEPPQEPETNSESSAPSSSTPVPETSDPILDGSDEEEKHPEAQTHTLRDYQLFRDRVRRVPKDHPRYGQHTLQNGHRLSYVLNDIHPDARAARVGHPGRPLATRGLSPRLLFNCCCRFDSCESSLSPCLSVGDISSRLRPVSEGYNPDHHFSSLSMPRRGSTAAQRLVLVW
ncbi:hypothetical protein M9H77_24304 [Catharanthus roseus]|uniref:Uncharacterized protein n=1 Tax=Catharanthus roseus TaxID=4058 RepID=A0ACC0AZU6_CATRO|nr:hypothetical protein M9H77_24304 [Catharanthus roseus]